MDEQKIGQYKNNDDSFTSSLLMNPSKLATLEKVYQLVSSIIILNRYDKIFIF